MIGIVPRLGALYSQQSAKSVYLLSIANCKENRLVNYSLIASILCYISDLNLLVAFTCIASKT